MVSVCHSDSGDNELSNLDQKIPLLATKTEIATDDDIDDTLAVFMQNCDEIGTASMTTERNVINVNENKIFRKVVLLFCLATLAALAYVIFPVSNVSHRCFCLK